MASVWSIQFAERVNVGNAPVCFDTTADRQCLRECHGWILLRQWLEGATSAAIILHSTTNTTGCWLCEWHSHRLLWWPAWSSIAICSKPCLFGRGEPSRESAFAGRLSREACSLKWEIKVSQLNWGLRDMQRTNVQVNSSLICAAIRVEASHAVSR